MVSYQLPLTNYLMVSAILFVISVAGIIINRRNLIVLLMCIELMLLSVNTNFVAFATYGDHIVGEIFVFFMKKFLQQASLENQSGFESLRAGVLGYEICRPYFSNQLPARGKRKKTPSKKKKN